MAGSCWGRGGERRLLHVQESDVWASGVLEVMERARGRFGTC